MNSTNSPLAGYPSVITLPIIWGDMDAFQHVNNTVHLRWLESSRIRYIEMAGMRDLMEAHKIGPILAAIHCDYKRQLRYPGNVDVGSRVTRVGRSSMTVTHRIVNQETSEIAAEGESTVVIFDFEKQRPVRMPQDVRDAIEKFQGDCPE